MKMLKCFFLVIVMNIVFITGVNAECSYKERSSLLKYAKEVDIVVELKTKKDFMETLNIETNQVEKKEVEVDYFVYNITNLNKDLFIKVYNNDNPNEYFYVFDYSLENGIYKFEVNDTMKLMKYHFEFYSNNPNCLGQDVSKKTLIKPKYNDYSDLDICKYDQTINHKYCRKYIDKSYKDSDVYNTLQKLVKNSDQQVDVEEKKESFLFKYWYLSVSFIVIIIIVIVFLIMRRKKNEL